MASNMKQTNTESDYAEMCRTLGGINEQIRALNHQTSMMKTKFNSFQTLGDKYDNIQEGHQDAKQNLAELQREVRVFRDRVNNNIAVELMFKDTLAQTALMEAQGETLRLEYIDLQKKDARFKKREIQHQAVLEEQMQLQKDIEKTQGAIKHYNVLKKTHKILKEEIEATLLENGSLKGELVLLKARQTHCKILDKQCNVAKVEKEGITLQNLTLRIDIQKLSKELGNENVIQEMLDAMNASKEEESRQNKALEVEMFELEQRLLLVEDSKESFNLAKAETDAIIRKNEELQTKIEDANEQIRLRYHFKGELEKLDAAEKPLQAEKRVLSQTLAEVQQKLLGEVDWQQKHSIQRELSDNMQMENDKAAADIHFFQDQLKILSECKVQYKSMKMEKKRVSKHNNTLRKQLDALQKKCSSEQPLQEKISTVQADNTALQSQNQDQRNQIKTLTDMLSLYDSLRADNSTKREESDHLLKNLREVIKGVDRRAREARR
ncbi:hypothetical protein PBY51_000455 [Eleginops maclovinus]|uniref:Uncharacterized protein n=1 Tax=Eleginops maclovinus TaxID=56733 RepID=A0AAN8AI29_ELEMC|nr:hypothetical protein PBY51_000455 [Eleginops maclovinus]